MSATAAAVIYGAFTVASSAANAMGNYAEQKRLERLNKYNAKVTAEKIKALNYEEAMNETLRRLNAYSEIASGSNMMGSNANIGTSADSAVINAYMNLAGDLSAMSFNYDNKRIDLRTERNNYLYQAAIAKAQKKSAVMAGILSTGSSAMQSYLGYSAAGGELGTSNKIWDAKYWDTAYFTDEAGNRYNTWHGGMFSSVFGSSTPSTEYTWKQAAAAGRIYDYSGKQIL